MNKTVSYKKRIKHGLKLVFLFLLMGIIRSNLSAQSAPTVDSTSAGAPKRDDVYMVVEDGPLFPGGEEAMKTYISQTLNYPMLALENNIEGLVVVRFIVNETGKIDSVMLLSQPLGWGLDEEAIRIVESMPTWKPGKQRGKEVKVRYVLPIRFKIDKAERKKQRKKKH